MKNIDLHMHSNHSLDGDYDVETLAHLCAKNNLKVVALADHNNVKGYKEFSKATQNLGIKTIAAIEIDCHYFGVNLHVLGYHINPLDPRFNQLEQDIMIQEQIGAKERVRLIEELGIYVNHKKLDQLQINGIITGEMIAEASLHEPENKDNELLKPFLKDGHLSDNPYVNFYWEFCAQHKPASILITYPTLAEIVELIKDSGGIPILAHPGHNVYEDINLLDGIMNSGVLGLEVYSSYHTEEQTKFYENYAHKNNLLMTCGSDFHGKIKPAIKLANQKLSKSVEEEILKDLKLS